MEITKKCEVIQFPNGGGSGFSTTKRIATPFGKFDLDFILIIVIVLLVIFLGDKK